MSCGRKLRLLLSLSLFFTLLFVPLLLIRMSPRQSQRAAALARRADPRVGGLPHGSSASQQEQQRQRACRRRVAASVNVTDSPLTFSFPAFGSAPYCYQPTSQVLRAAGWREQADDSRRREATLVSKLGDPAKALAQGRPPYRRGHAYIDRLPNYTGPAPTLEPARRQSSGVSG